VAPLTAHPKTPEVSRFLGCYPLTPRALSAPEWKTLESRLLGSDGFGSVGPEMSRELQALFGPDEVLILVRLTTWQSEPVFGKRRTTGIDSGMTPPPVVGSKRVAVDNERWGWMSVNGSWAMSAPYPKRERTAHALEPILRGEVTERRPLAAASRLVFDEAKLHALLASHADDPLLMFAGYTDLALQSFEAGKGEEARRLVRAARQIVDRAAPRAEPSKALYDALGELEARAEDADDDPCAAKPH
jgi:hypothetical protein